jgi:DNA-binding response OmpR family regulator
VHVLLIDDDAELGAMLSEYLAGEGIETSLAATGEDGVAAALSQAYDAVVLDVMLPRMSGVEVLRRLRQSSRIPIIMLTAKGDDIDRVVGLEMGADDYLAKPCYPRELVARLRAVLRRTAQAQAPLPSAPLELAGLSLSPAHRRASWAGLPVELTVSEFNILEALMRGGGEVVSKDELSERALGRIREAYDRSVDVHVSNLRQKLQAVAGAAIEIVTVRAIGYRIEPRP